MPSELTDYVVTYTVTNYAAVRARDEDDAARKVERSESRYGSRLNIIQVEEG